MSNQAPAPDPKVVAYLQGQLARNPWHESEEIVAKRAKALRLERRNPQAEAMEHGRRREQVRETLARVRAAAFTGDAQTLAAEVQALPVTDFPDLAAAAARLQVILSSRAKLPTLVHAPDFDADFLAILKQVLVSPARETAVVKEKALVAFNRRTLRKRGQRMIGLVRRELPELYALERDWLDSLSSLKRRSYAGGYTASRSNNEIRWGKVTLVAVAVVVAMISGLLFGVKDDDRAPRNQSFPSRLKQPIRQNDQPPPWPRAEQTESWPKSPLRSNGLRHIPTDNGVRDIQPSVSPFSDPRIRARPQRAPAPQLRGSPSYPTGSDRPGGFATPRFTPPPPAPSRPFQ